MCTEINEDAQGMLMGLPNFLLLVGCSDNGDSLKLSLHTKLTDKFWHQQRYHQLAQLVTQAHPLFAVVSC